MIRITQLLSQTMISTSVLILLILLFRFLFKNRIAPMLQYSMWGLVPLRLIFPVIPQLFQVKSPVSVMNIIGTAQNTQPLEQLSMNNYILESQIPQVSTLTPAATASSVDWLLILSLLWITGSLIMLGFFIYTHITFEKKLIENRRLLRHVPVLDINKHNRSKVLPVYETDQSASPCLFRHRNETALYVTADIVDDPEALQFAVTHELCHEKHGDLFWTALRCLFLCIYWFHPLVWIAALFSKRDGEFACDEAVIRHLGEDVRFSYGKTILQMASSHKNHKLSYTSTSMSSGKRGLKERISRIVNQKKMMALTLATVLFCTVFTVGFTFTQASDQLTLADLPQVRAFATDWANTYCQRDAKKMMSMCANRDVYLQIGDTHDDEGEIPWMGMSSPWPWGDHPYDVFINQDNTFTVYYQYMVSDPHIYMGKQTVTYKKIIGTYKAVKAETVKFTINSKSQFEEAYGVVMPDFVSLGKYYQLHVENGQYDSDILCDPALAAIDQLFIENAKGKVISPAKDMEKGTAVVQFTWPDGSVLLSMVQPQKLGAGGIWTVEKILPSGQKPEGN